MLKMFYFVSTWIKKLLLFSSFNIILLEPQNKKKIPLTYLHWKIYSLKNIRLKCQDKYTFKHPAMLQENKLTQEKKQRQI